MGDAGPSVVSCLYVWKLPLPVRVVFPKCEYMCTFEDGRTRALAQLFVFLFLTTTTPLFIVDSHQLSFIFLFYQNKSPAKTIIRNGC